MSDPKLFRNKIQILRDAINQFPLAGLVVVDLYADWWVEAKNVLVQTIFFKYLPGTKL